MQDDVFSDMQMQNTGGQQINSHQLVTIIDGGGEKKLKSHYGSRVGILSINVKQVKETFYELLLYLFQL